MLQLLLFWKDASPWKILRAAAISYKQFMRSEQVFRKKNFSRFRPQNSVFLQTSKPLPLNLLKTMMENLEWTSRE